MIEQRENLIELSSRKRRIVAFLIDHFVITFLMVSIVFIALGPNFMNNDNLDNMESIMLWVMIPGFLLYLSKDSIQGISVGKWIMGIMVRNDFDNETPSFIKLFIRNLLIIIWPIEFLVLAISSDKKRLGDMIVRTKVIKNPNKPKSISRILALVFIGFCFFFFSYYTVGTILKNSDAYKVAIEFIESDVIVMETTGGIVGYGYMPKGNINITNGYGVAQLEIKVKGNTEDITVFVDLEKEPEGEWIIMDLR